MSRVIMGTVMTQHAYLRTIISYIYFYYSIIFIYIIKHLNINK